MGHGEGIFFEAAICYTFCRKIYCDFFRNDNLRRHLKNPSRQKYTMVTDELRKGCSDLKAMMVMVMVNAINGDDETRPLAAGTGVRLFRDARKDGGAAFTAANLVLLKQIFCGITQALMRFQTNLDLVKSKRYFFMMTIHHHLPD